MRRPFLPILLGLVGLLTVTPALIWAMATTFERVDDGLREWLSALAYTVPIGLGTAAVLLAVHGMLLNAAFQAEVAEELDELNERQLATAAVGAAAGAPAGDEAVTVAAGASMSARAGGAPAAPAAAGAAAGGAQKQGGMLKGRQAQRLKRRATNTARRQARMRSKHLRF